jgi:hypothetical protein
MAAGTLNATTRIYDRRKMKPEDSNLQSKLLALTSRAIRILGGCSMLKITVAAGVLLLACTIASAYDGGGRDGDWWTSHTARHEKLVWVSGFLDGQTFAHMEVDTIFDGMQTAPQNSKGSTIKAEIHSQFLREFNGVSPDALADGLDKIYADFRNRRIEAAEVMLAVMMSISGSSDTAVEKMLEVLRERAARLRSIQ